MATGALVFVDEMHTPLPHPFLDGEHLVVYDNADEAGFLAKLKFFLDRPTEMRRVAHQVQARGPRFLACGQLMLSFKKIDTEFFFKTA
jgi:hypothetical protein